ncbi:hypothetical protein ACFVYD_32625 [Streptomyces sp. NPDC058301]|uniref:hypothetical protein n=1 Tax=Streptomyces sp. NPDC058301 TaxID=3346436 RepID=UPI0036E0FB85
MGWWSDEGDGHKGGLIAVLDDGCGGHRDAIAADAPHAASSSWWRFDGSEGRPRAIGVRVVCDCSGPTGHTVQTWRGTTVHPVDFTDRDHTEGTDGESPHGPYAEWEREHLAPSAATSVPGNVTALIDAVHQLLTELAVQRPLAALTAAARLEGVAGTASTRAARAALDTGRSWTNIGTALGITRQAAHQRLSPRIRLAKEADQVPPAPLLLPAVSPRLQEQVDALKPFVGTVLRSDGLTPGGTGKTRFEMPPHRPSGLDGAADKDAE